MIIKKEWTKNKNYIFNKYFIMVFLFLVCFINYIFYDLTQILFKNILIIVMIILQLTF